MISPPDPSKGEASGIKGIRHQGMKIMVQDSRA